MSEMWKWIVKKKGLVSLVGIVAIGGGGAWIYTRKPTEPTRYVLASVTRETLITSVKGSGQVSGQSQLEIKPQVSGTILKVLVKPGQSVSSTTPLFEIDQKEALKTIRDATQSVRDARISLTSAQLSYNKLKQPPDVVALTQAEHAVAQATRDLEDLKAGPDTIDIQQAEADLRAQLENVKLSSDGKTPQVIRNAYDDAVPLLKSIAQSLQQALYDADAVLGIDSAGSNDTYERLLSVTDSSKLTRANALYPAAKASTNAFKQKTDVLKATNEDVTTIDTRLAEAQVAMDQMGPLLQYVYDALLNTVTSPSFSQSSLSSLQSNIQSNRSTISTKVTSLVSQLQAITQARTSYTTAQLNVQKSQTALDKLKRGADPNDIATAEDRLTEAKRSLEKLQKGTDPIDLSLSQNTVQQRQSALVQAQQKLVDAQQALANYTVRAPFDGVIAKLTAQTSDQASAGTVLATLVTPIKLVQLSLNEVDATKVKVDQKATLTFDAIPNLEIAGRVYEVDPLGTVSQGVVNYTVKVAFETQDERIKSGMSAAVSIITDVKTDVLTVPNAALRTVNNTSVVQVGGSVKAEANTNTQTQGVLLETPPESRPVQIGIANEQSTEILNGLTEGDRIVVRTIDPAASAARATQPAGTGAVRIPGLGGGGGNFRPAGR